MMVPERAGRFVPNALRQRPNGKWVVVMYLPNGEQDGPESDSISQATTNAEDWLKSNRPGRSLG